jgi:hypothetical protein
MHVADVSNWDEGWDERLFPFEEPEKLRDWLLENGQLALLEEFFPDWVKDNFEEAYESK